MRICTDYLWQAIEGGRFHVAQINHLKGAIKAVQEFSDEALEVHGRTQGIFRFDMTRESFDSAVNELAIDAASGAKYIVRSRDLDIVLLPPAEGNQGIAGWKYPRTDGC